ncbi:hypothetical protein [Anaerotruncus colihominis]|uniref:hypothetical protein n=1 Tax=Anaerotruncus colihominis TaxID=169435 RepID=UPI0026ECB815|nr:hypothetical protein [Anaerotruncus colihominis]
MKKSLAKNFSRLRREQWGGRSKSDLRRVDQKFSPAFPAFFQKGLSEKLPTFFEKKVGQKTLVGCAANSGAGAA